MSHIEAGFHQRQTSHLAAGAAAAATVLGLSIVIGQMPSSGGASTPEPPLVPTTASAPSTPTDSVTPTTPAGSGYKDGTFQADASYRVERHQEQIGVTVSLQNGIITTVSIVNSESNSTSAFYQERFAQAFQAQVVGRPIADLKLPVIAGASKTTDGFNQAIDQVRLAAAVR